MMKETIKLKHSFKKNAMKKIIGIIFGCAMLCSCNTQPKMAAKSASAFITHKEAMDTIPVQSTNAVTANSIKALPDNYTELNRNEAKELLSNVDMDALISSFRSGDVVYNGFLGNNYYRVELYIKTVLSDSTNPFLLKVSGKSRYKKNILPFTGTIDIAQVYTYKDKSFGYQSFLRKKKGKGQSFKGDTTMLFYHARGAFTFAEDKSAKGSGVYSGNLFMDFGKDKPSGFLDEGSPDDGYKVKFGTENNTRKAGILMEGQWQNYAHTIAKHVIASKDLFMFANDILQDFSYGKREIEINQKYHALGWDNYWDGEEWWNDGKESTVLLSIY
jgi:hypothetical protein